MIRTEPLVCEHCSTSYIPQRYHSSGRNKYCSRECKNKARIARGDQWRAHKRWYLKTTYGITIEEYDALLADQGGGCAICRRTDPVGRKSQHGDGYWLHVDHDHTTGRIRGLLCAECNVGIGKFQDDYNRLLDAATYLIDFTP